MARWKTASDKEIASLKKHAVLNPVQITSVPAGHKVIGTKWELKIKADSTYKGRLVVQGFLQILGMSFTRDCEKGTITIIQKGYTKDVIQPYGMEGCNPEYNPGVGLELSLNQPEEKVLNEVEKRRYQMILEPYMCFAQVTRYGILYAVNQQARAMPMPAKAQMGATMHLLCYLVGSTEFSTTYKQGNFRVASFSDTD